MARAAEHSAFNFLAVAASTAAVKLQEGKPVDGAAIAMGAAAACFPSLPDILEPALHPNHRKIFHNLTMAFAVARLTHHAYKWEPQGGWEPPRRIAFLVGGSAYLARLARDAFTVKSLPLV